MLTDILNQGKYSAAVSCRWLHYANLNTDKSLVIRSKLSNFKPMCAAVSYTYWHGSKLCRDCIALICIDLFTYISGSLVTSVVEVEAYQGLGYIVQPASTKIRPLLISHACQTSPSNLQQSSLPWLFLQLGSSRGQM